MEFHTGLWSVIFLVSPKYRALGIKREGKHSWQRMEPQASWSARFESNL